MKKFSLALGVLLLLAFGLFFFAPASLLDTWFLNKRNSPLRLTNTEGSLWAGEGNIALNVPGAEALSLPKAQWRVSPIDALTGRLSGTLSAPDGSVSGKFEATDGMQLLRDLKLKMPINRLAMALLLTSLSPEGETTLDLPNISINNGVPTGGGQLSWQNASLSLPNTSARLKLGEVRAQLSMDPLGVRFTLSNQGGQATVNGSGLLSRGQATQIDLAVVPGSELGADVQVALAQLGKSEAGGVFRITRP